MSESPAGTGPGVSREAARAAIRRAGGSTQGMSESPAVTGPGVVREPRSGRRRWNEGVDVTAQPLLAACVMVALARHVLGRPSRRPARREPRAAIRPAPV